MRIIHGQKGVALLTVLLATALMAVLAVGMTTEQQIGIRRTENLFEGDQAMLLARGIGEWGIQVLTRDQQGADHLGEDWAMPLLPTPVGNGMVAGRIEDLQGRINVNNLLDQDPTIVQATKDRLARLYDLCEMDVSINDALVDWLDPDDTPEPGGGAEDDTYLIKDIPYRTANREMTSISELVLVEGMTRESFQCLQPNIAALPVTGSPGSNLINVNTAGAMVIASLANSISLPAAREIVEDRPEKGYGSLNDFFDHPRLRNSGVSQAVGLGLASLYFQMSGQAVFGRSEVSLYCSLERKAGEVKVFSYSIGAY